MPRGFQIKDQNTIYYLYLYFDWLSATLPYSLYFSEMVISSSLINRKLVMQGSVGKNYNFGRGKFWGPQKYYIIGYFNEFMADKLYSYTYNQGMVLSSE
jgi:hypothetical protein